MAVDDDLGTLLTAITTVLPLVGVVLGVSITPDIAERIGQDIVLVVQALGGLIGTVMALLAAPVPPRSCRHGDAHWRVSRAGPDHGRRLRRARNRAAQPSRTSCGARDSASESAGTSFVMTLPDPTYAPSPILTGATSAELEPMKAPAPIMVSCFWAPS